MTHRFSRRAALKAGALTGAFALSGGATALAAPRRSGRDVLVLVFLRGGADTLSLVVPYQDPDYHAVRPTLGIGASDVDDLDGTFGLCRTASALLPHYQAGELAIVQAVGSVHPTRSHFEAMWRIEQAAVSGGAVGDGWLARHLNATPAASSSATARALAVDKTLPDALRGSPETMAAQSLADLRLGGPQGTKAGRGALLRAMLRDTPAPDGPRGETSLELLEALDSVDFETRPVNGGAQYPAHPFGRALYETATLVQADVGVEAIEVDFGGWDHHTFAGPLSGDLADHARTLAEGLSAFRADLGTTMDRVTVMVMSEFGRRVDENGGGGFDHGRGGLAMVMGGAQVNGGQLYGSWPGLAPHQLDDEAIAVTTDIRDVIAEVLVKRMGTASLGAALPGHSPSFLGLVR